jgi:hypothetical protein
MDNPFPGMNPYLESPKFWKGFHGLFIAALTAELNRALPEPLVARYEQRLYVATWARSIYPDTDVLVEVSPAPTPGESGRGGVPTLAAPTDRLLTFVMEEEPVREGFVEIVVPTEDDETPDAVVTVVEVLSPANKEPESEGRDEYQRKQRAVLASEAHLLEIDLLRGGVHTVALDDRPIRAIRPFDYVYCLHRAGGSRYECIPFTLREPLPPLVVPLLDDTPDLILDAAAVFRAAWQAGAYGNFRYGKDPKPALDAEDAAWLDALLREKGLRP